MPSRSELTQYLNENQPEASEDTTQLMELLSGVLSGGLGYEKFASEARELSLSLSDLTTPLVGLVMDKFAKTRKISENLLRSEGYDLESKRVTRRTLLDLLPDSERSQARQSLIGF